MHKTQPLHYQKDLQELCCENVLIRPDQFNLLLLGYCEAKIGPSDQKKKEKKQLIGVWL